MNAAHSEEIAKNSWLLLSGIYREIIRITQHWQNTFLLEQMEQKYPI